ncbi:MAG: hypothetical protein CMO81_04875 [Waddliaceae bacterium]|nr:hypothetical protein [Waddliaceae bacterium]|tara:strand:+ start:196 stop:450 length:255 start_codon:yes stop_codon:yes gene_type:complete
MTNLAENFVIRFINITKKKDGFFANFRVKGIRGGASFSASVSVDLDAANVDPTDTIEDIVEACSKIAIRELRNSEFHLEGFTAA